MTIDRRDAIGRTAAMLGLVGASAQRETTPRDSGGAFVSLKDFGAVCDGHADDTAAVQRAVDHCATAAYPIKLIVPGRTRLTSSVEINRPADKTIGDFILEGNGAGAGFFIDAPITMFTSRLEGGMFGRQRAPSSEYIMFRDLLFEASDPSMLAFAISGRLFRYRVVGCSIRRLKWLAGADYVQSCYFVDCTIRGWKGAFFTADDGYDISIRGCAFEAGGAGFRFRGAVTKFAAFGEIYESCDGAFVAISGVNAFTVCGMYFEGNTASEILLGENDGVSRAVTILGCSFNLPARRSSDYPITLGRAHAVKISGNYSNGRLADNGKVTPWSLYPDANYSALGAGEFKLDPSLEWAALASGSSQNDAYEICHATTIFTSVAKLANGARLPAADAVRHVGNIIVANVAQQPLRVFPARGERFIGRPLNTPIAIPPGGRLEVQVAGTGSFIAHLVGAIAG